MGKDSTDYELLKRLSQNQHKVTAWLFNLLARIEQENVVNAEKTEMGNKTIVEILWK